jgi:hypothetical protein
MRLTPRTLLALGAVTLALGNVGRIPSAAFGGRAAALTLNDLMVIPLWIALFAVWSANRRRVALDAPAVPAFAFAGVAVFSTLLAVSRYGLDAMAALGVFAFLVRWVLYFGWYLLVTSWLDANEATAAWKLFDRALLAIAAFGVIQSLTMPHFAQMIHFGGDDVPVWDEQGRRLVSTLLDPNFAGVMIVMALLPRLARAAEGLRAGPLPLLLLSSALVLTVSRSSLLALGAGLLTIVAIRGISRRIIAIFLVGTVIAAGAMTSIVTFAGGYNKLGIDSSALQRLIPWWRAMQLITAYPLLGIGFNAISYAQRDFGWRAVGGAEVSFDGGLLFITAMTGIVGLLAYLWLLKRVWSSSRCVWRERSVAPSDRAFAAGTAAMTVAVVVHSLFANSLLLPFVMQLLWLRWGATVVIARQVPHAARHGVLWRRIARAGALPAAFVLAATLTACDPCGGVATCSTGSRVDVEGQILNRSTGVPVSGVTISLAVRSPGTATVVATTDAEGRWRTTTSSIAGDSAIADISVLAPGHTAYAVKNVVLRIVTGKGDAVDLGPWTSTPFARAQLTALHGGAPLAGATVTFARTGGAPASPVQQSTVSNGAGIFEIALEGTDLGITIGTLQITQSSLSRVSVLTGFPVTLDYHYGIPQPGGTVNVDGQLVYGGQVIFRGTGAGVPGATVTFTRTSGIALTKSPVTVQSGATGFFALPLSSAAFGSVTGDLTLVPPNGGKGASYTNLVFSTYDSSSIRSAGLFAYGERWAWAVELWRNDHLVPVPNLKATFTRTGGLAITPSTLNVVSGADGRIQLLASVQDTGTVVGDITVFPDSGPSRVISGLHLRTAESDQLQFAGVYGFGPALRYVGEVQRQDGTPVVGAHVTWTQTSGIVATPTVLSGVTDVNGRFPLLFYPTSDGSIFGTVTIMPPAPWVAGTTFTFTNLRLDTFQSGALVLAISYRIPNP